MLLVELLREKEPFFRIQAAQTLGQMRGLGLESEFVPVEGAGTDEGARVSAVGRLRGTGGGKSLLFNGHLDTNPVSEGWTVDPWAGRSTTPLSTASASPT